MGLFNLHVLIRPFSHVVTMFGLSNIKLRWLTPISILLHSIMF